MYGNILNESKNQFSHKINWKEGTIKATQTPPCAKCAVPVIAQGEKSEKFTDINFKWRQQKMLFYLTILNLVRFLKDDAPNVPKVSNSGCMELQ